MTRAASPFKNLLAALLLLIPLIAGTIYATVANLDVSRAWSATEEITGAPAAALTTNNQELIDARRAAGEAGVQAGFLTSGTGQLVEGTQQLVDGAKPLGEGVIAAAHGAQQLHEGLVQLQAGTGQMGTGATEIADGVAGAVEQLNGLMIVQQQLLTAMSTADAELAKSPVPEAKDLRTQLAGLRTQVENFGISVETTDKLNDLRTGTRDLANQLSVPGYGFHDGIYEATNGAADLAAGLADLEKGVDDAVAGFQALDDGANQLDSMANLTAEKTDAVQRALPVPQVPTGAAAASEEERSTALAPMYAFLISALVMLAGAALGWATFKNRLLFAFVLLGITAIGGIILFTVALGMSAVALAGALAILLLATIVAALITRVLINFFGTTAAIITAIVGWIAQIAVTAHVWSVTAVSDISVLWRVVAGLMPLHYPTFAVTSIGNSGSQAAIWMAVAVLAGVGIFAGMMIRATAAEPEVVED